MIPLPIILDVVFGLICLTIGLVAVAVSFGIVIRTKEVVRRCFLFVFLAMVIFVIFSFFWTFESFFTIGYVDVVDFFGLFFILFLLAGLWKLKTVIKGLSDFGQAFVLTSHGEYEEKIAFILKGVRNVCYVSLDKPYKKIVDFLNFYGVDTSDIWFIDASGAKSYSDNCISIKNNPDEIKKALERMLKEKEIGRVIIDNISAVKKIRRFELPKFVQDTASLIKANEAQGFFIGKIEDLNKQIINDISMLVDKIVRSGEK
jgi:hypothetical protein